MDYIASPVAMARTLVQYMTSNIAIQREVEAATGSQLTLQTISRLRTSYMRPEGKQRRDFDRSVVWMDERHERNMHDANERFVAALTNARAA